MPPKPSNSRRRDPSSSSDHGSRSSNSTVGSSSPFEDGGVPAAQFDRPRSRSRPSAGSGTLGYGIGSRVSNRTELDREVTDHGYVPEKQRDVDGRSRTTVDSQDTSPVIQEGGRDGGRQDLNSDMIEFQDGGEADKAVVASLAVELSKYGLVPHDSSSLARKIAGKVCNEGLAAPSKELIRRLKIGPEDLAQALLTVAEFVHDQCQQIVDVNKYAQRAEKISKDWRPISATSIKPAKRLPEYLLRDNLHECLRKAAKLSGWRERALDEWQ